MGFEELQHTADWALRVWADDLPSLFTEAARGMNALTGLSLRKDQPIRKHFETKAGDAEALLVAFLSELIFLEEQENIGFDQYQLELDGMHLKVDMQGSSIESMNKVIKAVTFHRLNIRRNPQGFEVEIVFDV